MFAQGNSLKAPDYRTEITIISTASHHYHVPASERKSVYSSERPTPEVCGSLFLLCKNTPGSFSCFWMGCITIPLFSIEAGESRLTLHFSS